jgi:ABC-type multidrug transport system fused ATPase/permease subunit
MHHRSEFESVRQMARMLAPHRWAVAAALVSMASASLGLLALPLMVRGLLERAARDEAPSAFNIAGMALLLAALAVTAYFSAVVLHEVARKVCASLRSQYAARWFRSSMAAHRSVPAGEYAERLNSCLSDIDWFVKGSLGNLLALVLVMVGGACMLFWISWRLALVIIVVGPAVVFALRFIEREGRKLLRESRQQSEKMAGLLQGVVLGLDVVKAFNAEEEAARHFGARQEKLLEIQRKESFVTSLVEPLLIFAGAVTFLLVVFMAGRLIAEGSLNLPEFVTFLVYLMFVLPNLRNFGMQIGRWRHVKVALDFLEDQHHLPEEADPETALAPAGGGRLEFRGVFFRYPGRAAGLGGISFVIEQGEHVGVVGESGAGKSTLFSLLLQFYRPQSGTISIEGTDLCRCSVASVRRLFAYVPQDIVLFDGTLRDNMLLAAPRASDEEILEACRAAQALTFLESLPHGLDTQAGDRGLRLSAGQRQRLAIARALLRKSPILLLDEATSALDPKTERLFGASLRDSLAGRTAIIVAHRLTAVADLPRIIYIDNGVVVSQGTHRELLSNCPAYRAMAGGQPVQR